MRLLIRALTISASIGLLSGCGGGGGSSGGSSGGDSTDIQETVSNTISGAAFKGLINGGIVDVYEMTSNNIKGYLVGSVVTDSDGAYTITLSDTYDTSKNVIVELSTSTTTSITCDARNGCGPNILRGDVYTPSSDFKLSSISAPISGSTNVSVTPYTDMAKAYFDSNPSDGVNAAISRVNQIAGVNILSVIPIDITGSEIDTTSSKEQQRYAVMLAAYASTIFGDGTVSISEAEARINSTSSGFADGIIGNGSDEISATDLMNAVKSEVNNAGSALNTDMLSSVTSFVAIKELDIVDSKFITETPVDTDLDTVAKAKVLVADTRTWIDSFDTLETPANAFKEQADSISSILNDKTDVVFDNLIWVGKSVGFELKKARQNGTSVPSEVDVNNGSGIKIGTATLTGDSNVISGASYAAEAVVDGVTIQLIASLNRDYINDISADKGVIVLDFSASAKNNYAEVTFANTKLTLVSNVDIFDGGFATDFDSISIDGGIFRAEVLVSGVRTGKMIEGNINLELIKATNSSDASISEDGLNLKKFELSKLKITDEDGSYTDLTIRISFDNAAVYNVFSDIRNNENHFAKGEINITGELDLATKPKALVSLTVSSSVFERGIAKLLVSYDSKSLEFAVSNLGETVDDRKLEVSNQDGYKLVFEWTEPTPIDEDPLKQSVGKGKLYAPDGTEVGRIDKTSTNVTIIRYNDGTIESF